MLNVFAGVFAFAPLCFLGVPGAAVRGCTRGCHTCVWPGAYRRSKSVVGGVTHTLTLLFSSRVSGAPVCVAVT